mgnify:CR=1 FL=1
MLLRFPQRQGPPEWLIGDLKALAPEGQCQLDRDGSIARRVTAQEGQRGGVSAVVHLAGELFRLEEGDVLGVGDDELTLGLSRRHHQLTQNSLRLLRRSDADGVLPHDAIGPDGVSRSVERLAALAAGVMRKDAVCVTAPEQPKSVLSELIVAAGKCGCELVVPDPEDITFLEAEKFASKVDYGGYTVPLAFLGRHAAGSAAMAVELSLALCRKGFDVTDDAILEGLAAVENRSSIRVISQRPLIILDACRTPQQAAALLRVLNMAKVRHMSAIIGLAEEEGAEAFFSALETGLTPEEQKKDKSTMPGMSENPFDKVYLVTPQAAMTR